MEKQNNNVSYHRFVGDLIGQHKDTHSYDEIMEMAIGGYFEIIGLLERELLIQNGLKPEHYLVDVGCGSGRLAKPLSNYLTGSYLGIDLVPELITYAQDLVGRPDWRFEVAQGLVIPEEDGQVDIVCFFSVLTHLRHEASYLYLQEAARVLKPDGKIIFSFLEFYNPDNWEIFQNNINHIDGSKPLNQFMSIEAIKIWAYRLGLEVKSLNRGGKISLADPLVLKDGETLQGSYELGQSICVLTKQTSPSWRRKVNDGFFRLAAYFQQLQF